MKKILFTLLLVLGISAAADAQVRFLDSSTDAVRKEAIAQDKLVFIDLYATWCGPCKMMGPVLEELAAAHPTVKVGKLNTDENLKLAMARKIDAIPALLLFRNGQEVSRSVGYKPAAELEAWLRENGAI